MAFKLLTFISLVAVARAGNLVGAPLAATPFTSTIQHVPLTYHAPVAKLAAPVAYAAPVAKAVVAEEYDANPQYSYGYDVQDSLTGDSKSQTESRNGDVVQGSYSVVDPDGTKRTVDYTADPFNGFNAVVRREPLVAAKAVVAAPVAYAAPVARLAAPVAYAAPVAKLAAAPVAYAAAAPVAYASAAPVAKLASPLAYAAPVAKIGAPLSYSTSVFH